MARLFGKQDKLTITELLRIGKGAKLRVVNTDGSESTIDLTELGVLDGLTATTAELNTMDGITATTDELNRAADVSTRVVDLTAATLSVTETSHDGKTITVNKADGTTITLPAATGSGARFRFVVGTTITLNNLVVQVADGTDVMTGVAIVANDVDATVSGWETAADSDTITMNGTTTGGIKGDIIELEDIAADLYSVRITGSASGTEATMFSSAVS